MLKKAEIESEIRSRMTEIGSPSSVVEARGVEIENKPLKTFSLNNYQKKKRDKKDIDIPLAPKHKNKKPLESSSLFNSN